MRVPEQIIELMDKAPHARTEEDMNIIGRSMSSLPSFRKYSHEMQRLMCQIVRYMK